ncbi:MAG: response regulator transcription factor [Bacteroidota bacterium]
MKILIVEDDLFIAEHLKEIILELEIDQVEHAASGARALEMCDKNSYDLALLDINMESAEAGIGLAKVLKEVHYIPFIFITAQSDKRIVDKAIELQPEAFLVKPFVGVSVLAAINIARQSIEKNNLVIRDNYKDVIIPKKSIIYGKTSDNYIEIFSAKRKWVIRSTLGNLLNLIDSQDFIQVHRSYFVNTNFVDSAGTSKLSLNSGSLFVPVSKAYEEVVRITWKSC